MKLGNSTVSVRIGNSSFARVVVGSGGGEVSVPVFTVNPAVSGLTTPGATLTRSLGSASGATTISGQWFKNDTPTGVTMSTYAITVAGDMVKWAGVATNAAGSDTADSNVVTVAVAVSAGAGILFQWMDTSELEDEFLLRVDDGTGMATVDTAPLQADTGTVGSKTVYGFEFSTAYDTEVLASNEIGGYPVSAGSVLTRPEFGPTGLTEDAVAAETLTVGFTPPAALPLTGFEAYARRVSPPGLWELKGTAVAAATTIELVELVAEKAYEVGVLACNTGPGGFKSRTNYNPLTAEFSFDEILNVTTPNYALGWSAPRSIPAVGYAVVETLGQPVIALNLGTVNTQNYNGVEFTGTVTLPGMAQYNDGNLASDGELYNLRIDLCYGTGANPTPIDIASLEIGATYLLQCFMSDDRGGGTYHGRTNTYTIAGQTSAACAYGPAHAVTCIFTAAAVTEQLLINGSAGAHLSAFQVRKIS